MRRRCAARTLCCKLADWSVVTACNFLTSATVSGLACFVGDFIASCSSAEPRILLLRIHASAPSIWRMWCPNRNDRGCMRHLQMSNIFPSCTLIDWQEIRFTLRAKPSVKMEQSIDPFDNCPRATCSQYCQQNVASALLSINWRPTPLNSSSTSRRHFNLAIALSVWTARSSMKDLSTRFLMHLDTVKTIGSFGCTSTPGKTSAVGSMNCASQFAGMLNDGAARGSPKIGANHGCSQGKTIVEGFIPVRKAFVTDVVWSLSVAADSGGFETGCWCAGRTSELTKLGDGTMSSSSNLLFLDQRRLNPFNWSEHSSRSPASDLPKRSVASSKSPITCVEINSPMAQKPPTWKSFLKKNDMYEVATIVHMFDIQTCKPELGWFTYTHHLTSEFSSLAVVLLTSSYVTWSATLQLNWHDYKLENVLHPALPSVSTRWHKLQCLQGNVHSQMDCRGGRTGVPYLHRLFETKSKRLRSARF